MRTKIDIANSIMESQGIRFEKIVKMTLMNGDNSPKNSRNSINLEMVELIGRLKLETRIRFVGIDPITDNVTQNKICFHLLLKKFNLLIMNAISYDSFLMAK